MARARVPIRAVVDLDEQNFEHLTQAATGATSGDWLVLFCKESVPRCVKVSQNWQRVAVTLIALESRSELNGRVGTVEGWDSSRGRYEVRMAAGVPWVKVRPYNVILPQGSRATITGLARATEHNGVVGRIASHDGATCRYGIDIQGGIRLNLRRENALL